MGLRVYAESDIGNVRAENQDNFAYGNISESITWALVCDGMGGGKAGKVASSLLVEYIREIMKNLNRNSEELKDIPKFLYNSINNANLYIFNKSRENEDYNGMGTTVVLAIVSSEKIYTLHVGDSRAYLIKNKKIDQITVDHSIVQEMVDMGEITLQEAMFHPRKNIITKAIGIKETVEPDFSEKPFENGSILLMCTDGLTNHLDNEEILNISLGSENEEIVKKLISGAKTLGGKDNITVLAVFN